MDCKCIHSKIHANIKIHFLSMNFEMSIQSEENVALLLVGLLLEMKCAPILSVVAVSSTSARKHP